MTIPSESTLFTDQSLRSKLNAIDRLRQLGVSNDQVILPSIVVVGDQSSGKSSTLESIAGIELPKGKNIVTRNPIILRMVKIPENQKSHASLEAENQPTVTIEDFSEIPERINSLADEINGKNAQISDKEITLTVYKHNVHDLTLVDLPGIARVSTGDQPKNIYEIIKAIILKYITPSESVILNVCSAAVDFQTCETIQLSREVDPEGIRTIGVCTKLDTTDLVGMADRLLAHGKSDVKLRVFYY